MKAKLADLIGSIGQLVEVVGPSDVAVTEITTDSRRVVPESLFACMPGARVDGCAFAPDAVRRGASVVLSEKRLPGTLEATQVVVADVRRALAEVAASYYGYPSRHLKIVGVTGTNGKTTTVHLVRAILESAGEKVGVMGTLGHWLGGSFTKDTFTTPEAPEVQRYLRAMLDCGATRCAMEVSSHAIALRRVDEVSFDVVAFTNLTRDHLDFHADFGAYRMTKMELFGIGEASHGFGAGRRAAVNVADPAGVEIVRRSPLQCITFAVGSNADVRGDIEDLSARGLRIAVRHGSDRQTVETALRGRVNAENVLAAYTIGIALGLDKRVIASGIAALQAVPGRMEFVEGADRQAIVDYAHTPDALKRLLEGTREMGRARIICVFGCGGDRDRGKRPEMGKIAASLADYLIVTSDNPRTEDPLEIIEEIKSGIPGDATYEIVPDRARAIERAVALSEPGDMIVVAGKGHEDYQIIGESRIHFDDKEILRRAFGAIANAQA